MNKKRLLSMLLCLMLLISMFPASVFAVNGAGLVTPGDPAKLELVYMEYNDGVTDENMWDGTAGPLLCHPADIPETMVANQEILIGIRLSGIEKIKEVAQSDLGLYNIQPFIAYDPTYLTYQDGTGDTLKASVELRIGTEDAQSLFKKNRGVSEYKIDEGTSVTDEPSTTPETSGMKVVAPTVTFKNKSDAPTYKGGADDSKYLAIIRFTATGEQPANGGTVIKFDDSQNAAVSFGVGGAPGSYEGNHSSGSYNSIFEFDESLANLFPKTYTVSFDARNGSSEQTISVPETNPVIGDKMPTDPTQDGKFFGGWVLDDNDNGTYEEDTDVTPLDETTTITTDMVGDDSTVKAFATWNAGHIITFEGNQGHVQGDVTSTSAIVTMSTTKTTLDGETIPVMERTGYTFDSWNTAQNGTGTRLDATNLTTHAFTVGDTNTLYAQWTPTDPDTAVTVTFDKNGGDVDSVPTTKTIVSGQAIGAGNMPNAPTKANYTLDGWNTEQNGSGTPFKETTAVTGDITVYAQWTPENPDTAVTVTFDNGSQPNATSANPSTKDVVNGDSIGATNMPDYPTVNGFYCTGWNTVADGSGEPFTGDTPVTADIRVYAQWDENLVITFDANGGAFNDGFTDRTATLDATKKLTAADLAKFDGAVTKGAYTFSGWYEAANGSGNRITTDTAFTASATVYARWEAGTLNDDDPDDITPDADAILIRFNANGGTAVIDPAMMSRLPNDALAASAAGMPTAPTREAFTFDGWNTQSNGEGKDVVYSTTAGALAADGVKDVTVYAKWKLDESQVPEEDRATITFHKNDGTTETKSITIKKNTTLNVTTPEGGTTSYEPVFVRAPFTFVNWVEEDGTVVDFDTRSISADLDVYAKWTLTIDSVNFSGQTQTYDGTPKSITVDSIMVGGVDVKDTLDYEVEYAPADDQNNKQASVTNAGEYIATIKAAASTTVADTITVTKYEPDNGFTIEQKKIPFIVGAQTVAVSEDNITPQALSITVDASDATLSAAEKALTADDVTYYSFKDGVDKTGALTLDDLTALSGAPTAQGDYLVSFRVSDANYAASQLKLEDGSDALLYTTDTNAAADKKLDPLMDAIKFSLIPDSKLEAVSVSVTNLSTSAITAAALYTDNTLATPAAFDTATEDYYVTIPTNSDVVINLKGAFDPDTAAVYTMNNTAQADVKPVKVDGTTDEWTVTIPKDKLAVAAGETGDDLFKNTLAITIGSKTYTIKLKQQAEAKITLNYGNSPYGEIMKDDVVWKTLDAYKNDPDGRAKWQEDAKESFNSNNLYTGDFVPEHAKDRADKLFGTRAWVNIADLNNITEEEQTKIDDPTINLDRNEKAIFIFNGESFKDPGFVAVNSDGATVDTLNRSIEIGRMNGNGYNALLDSNFMVKPAYNFADSISEFVITDLTKAYSSDDEDTFMIRPDSYQMEYSFYDEGAQTTISAIRKVVVLNGCGDIDLSISFSLVDGNTIASLNTQMFVIPGEVKDSAERLYLYRMVDIDRSNSLSLVDKNTIAPYVASTVPPEDLYIRLSQE